MLTEITMKTLPIIATLALTVASYSQSKISGVWQTEASGGRGGIDMITMELHVDGDKLTGQITRTDPPGQDPVAIAGKATETTVVFTVKSPDGKRVITFKGRLEGNQLVFSREVQGTGGGRGIYGLDGPSNVTARRVK